MTDSKIKFSNSTLDFTYFGQIIERQIPKTILESYTNAFQKDENHRIFYFFKYNLEKLLLNLKQLFTMKLIDIMTLLDLFSV